MHSGTYRPYRPSSGTEGEVFMSEWCANCSMANFDEEGEACMINVRTMVLDINDPDYPPEWNFTNGGVPQCTAFTTSGEVEPRCDQTVDMFSNLDEVIQ